jgi:hypothetical protein
MLKKAYKTIVVFILAGLLAAACTPGVVDEGINVPDTPGVIEIATPVGSAEEQELNDLDSPIIPETGGQVGDSSPDRNRSSRW